MSQASMHLLSQYGQSSNTNSSMPGQNGTQGLPWGSPFPSLHLWPIQDTFAMKMIHLPEGQRVKIGRQTNAKTVPGERNAYFDSKVLSRTHAEIWEQGGKIYIKDLKSSNGTFINNERLSPEGVESEPLEVKSEDIVEFGIDIVSEDNRTIVHHKVAAKVYCVFGAEDAALSARELVHYQSSEGRRRLPAPAVPGQAPAQMAQISQPVLSSGGKPNGLTFDHVLSKLQNELQKSKDTGADLQIVSSAMNEIQDTLGGGLPPSQNGSAVQFIPPQFRSASAEAQAALAGPHGTQAAAFIALQNQLGETQSALTSHLEKIQQLEGQMREQNQFQLEMINLREQVDSNRRDFESYMTASDDDDARSVVTIMDCNDAEERVQARRAEGADGDRDLTARVQSLSAEIAEAVQVSRTLSTQHSETMSVVRSLNERIGALEANLAERVAEEVGKAEQRWETWRIKFEDGWRRERESWETERERLRGVVREWEEASRRGREEVEDRELNDSLSAENYSDEEEAVWKEIPRPNTARRVRRRRPSHRTSLAVRALKGVIDKNGAATPKADPQSLADALPDAVINVGNIRSMNRRQAGKAKGGVDTAEKDSSESGRDSGDTLRESEKESNPKIRPKEKQSLQKPTIPVFTVLIVAVVAGALYWKHRE